MTAVHVYRWGFEAWDLAVGEMPFYSRPNQLVIQRRMEWWTPRFWNIAADFCRRAGYERSA